MTHSRIFKYIERRMQGKYPAPFRKDGAGFPCRRMETSDFKTRSFIRDRYFPCPDDVWVTALDIGYSGVKGISPNKYFCIPCYARKLRSEPVRLTEPAPADILYQGDEGLWSVGELAYQEVDSSRVPDNEPALYGRNRYFSPMFRVVAETGIGLALMGNRHSSPEGKKLVLQTGLPPQYLEDDKAFLKEILSGVHSFELKAGNQPWRKVEYSMEEDGIYVMSQPLGAFSSVCYDSNGQPMAEAWELYNSNVLVFDPGFGTLDLYLIRKGHVSPEFLMTLPNMGMKEVFARTCRDIHSRYGVNLQINELQNRLDEGNIRIADRRTRRRTSVPFADILEKNSNEVCAEALDTIFDSYDGLEEIDVIIGTGGTYDAWKDNVSGELKDMEGIVLMSGNKNDSSLSNIFSNVRGYYFQRVYQAGRR